MYIKNNRRTRPLVALTLVAILATLSLSACGESTSTSSPPTTTATTAATTAAATTSAAASTAAGTTVAATTVATVATAVAATTANAATVATGTTAAGTTSAATNAAGTTANSTTAVTTSGDTSPKVVEAANAFLATLDSTQKSGVLFDFSNTAQKQKWSNFPNGAFQRSGLMWGNLSTASQDAWLKIMSTTLSARGYQRIMEEWDADDALAGTEQGGGALFGKKYYWIAIIGTPSMTSAWQWQWGGHHVTINATVANSNITLAPSFIGDQPASYTDSAGKTVVPLGDIETTALSLVNSLDATQKPKAVLGTNAIDLVLGPGQDGKKIASEGLKASEMTAEQQTRLITLMGYYGNMLNDEDAALRAADLKSHLSDTYFAWYGPTTAADTGYFRITGPTVVIEYSPQFGGGGGGRGNAAAATTAASTSTAGANHIHGIYRDPTNDYGVAIAAQ